MLSGIRHLSIEAGPRCNLSAEHTWCPSAVRPLAASRIEPKHAIAAIIDALALGFEGFVGFHYYNEPTLYPDFIREVMDAVPRARYVLWTNGTGGYDLYDKFDWVVVTNYKGLGLPEHPNLTVYPVAPDSRLDGHQDARDVRCWRPRIEVPISCDGFVRLCCQDWQGRVLLGNIIEDSFGDIMQSPDNAEILAHLMSDGCGPDVCRTCTNPVSLDGYLSALRQVGM